MLVINRIINGSNKDSLTIIDTSTLEEIRVVLIKRHGNEIRIGIEADKMKYDIHRTEDIDKDGNKD